MTQEKLNTLRESPEKEQWTQNEAIELCRAIEGICPRFGCHVALTGGLLYKDGPRKDCDILFYRIREISEIDIEGLWDALESIGLSVTKGFGWCYKATYKGKPVDCFMPEEQGGEYYGDPEFAALNFDPFSESEVKP